MFPGSAILHLNMTNNSDDDGSNSLEITSPLELLENPKNHESTFELETESTCIGHPTINELNDVLQKELFVDDALILQGYKSKKGDMEDQSHREQLNVEKIYTNIETGEKEYPPDGGYGWVCVACATTIQFSVWGNNSGFGVFLAYYINNNTFPGATAMDFAWLAGMTIFFAQLCAPFAMISSEMIGFKTTMSIACALHFLAFLLASFATEIWQLYLCQGFIVGVSYSFISFPAFSIIPSWFLRKRSIASGIVVSGTGLGGVFFSLTINAIIERTGDKSWALRMIAIFCTVTISISIFFIKRRNEVPRQKITLKNFIGNCKGIVALKVIKSKRLWYISFWFSLMMFAYNLVVFSYSSVASSLGLSAQQGSVLTATLNAAQCIGRPAMGFVADYAFGRINYTLILTAVISIIVLGFWKNVTSFAGLLICALCFGLTLGVGNVMNQVLIADSFSPDEFVPAWSILNVFMAFFILFVEVIALSLKDTSLQKPFLYTQIFAGVLCLVALITLSPLRELQIKKQLLKTKNEYSTKLEMMEKQENVTESDYEDTAKKLKKIENLLAETAKGYFSRLFHRCKV